MLTQKYCVSPVLHLMAFWCYPSKTVLSIHYWWFKFADNWRHQGLLLPVFWPSLLLVVPSSGINFTSCGIHFTTSWFLGPKDLWLYFVPILCLTSAHGCSFPSALPNRMIICCGCSLSSLISQNFLFSRIFLGLLISAIGTLPGLYPTSRICLTSSSWFVDHMFISLTFQLNAQISAFYLVMWIFIWLLLMSRV